MMNRLVTLVFAPLLFFVSPLTGEGIAETPDVESDNQELIADGISFYVIPVRDAIAPPTVYAVRAGVKTAIEEEFDYVVLDMKTPGGRLDSTLEIMEILDRFPGKTITYVNDEASSAGAIIASMTNEIYFSPKATMGSAEPVSGKGEDINDSMKRKVMSFLNAKVEAYTDEYPFRSDVIRAMMDPDFELKIGEEVLCEKGVLLNLNAKRAHMEYGDPPRPILGSGIVDELDDLLHSLALGKETQIKRFEATWSLHLAHLIVMVAPFLLSLAIISVYIEFQSPGFGVFGVVGVSCFLIAIFGHHVAGLSGQEPLLLFVLGVLLLALEIFIAPGTLFFAIPGMIIMIASLIWSMTDIWPANTPDYSWNWEMFERPLQNLMGGALLGIIMIVVIARFLPKSLIWDRLVLKEAIAGNSQTGGEGDADGPQVETGAEGIASSELVPAGEVEIDGHRYEASLAYGSLERGTPIRVVSKSDFGFIVEEVKS